KITGGSVAAPVCVKPLGLPMPLTLGTDTIPLLVVAGIVGYIGAQEAWRARAIAADPIHLAAALFAFLSLFVVATRFIQRATADPTWAEVAIRAQLGVAIMILPVAYFSIRVLAGERPSKMMLGVVGGITIVAVCANLFTDLFMGSPAEFRADALGSRYYELPLQPGIFLVFGAIGYVLVTSLLRVRSMLKLRGGRLRWWVALALVGAFIAVNDLLLAAQWVNS